MSVPNTGREQPGPNDPLAFDSVRKGNPALVYRDDLPTDEVAAASTRAHTLSHRFGGVRYALTRPNVPPAPESGESDPQD